MSDRPTTLAAALAQLQADLPDVGKGNTAEVQGTTKGGQPFKYKYKYADLADVSKAILPKLGPLGLSWITRPTITEAGKFVLAYELLHVSGDSRTGEYPLQLGTPQEMGSAITYARRYALCSVTGVAPESDDDDGAHASQRRESWDDAKPAQPPRPPHMRENVIRNAKSAISNAPDRESLDAIDAKIAEAVEKRFITDKDAVDLRRLKVARLDALFPLAQEPLQAETPEETQ